MMGERSGLSTASTVSFQDQVFEKVLSDEEVPSGQAFEEVPSDEKPGFEESGAEWLHSYNVWSRRPIQSGATPERVVVIVNPRSGRKRGLKVLEEIRPLFERQGVAVRVVVTRGPGHAAELAHEAEEHSICVVGGRGTVNDVVNGIMRRGDRQRVTLGLIPSGGAQNLCYDMGVRTAAEGVQRVLYGQVRRMDVLSVEICSGDNPLCDDPVPASAVASQSSGPSVPPASDAGTAPQVTYALNVIGWGLAGRAAKDADRFRFLGQPCYNLGAYKQLVVNRSYGASIVVPACEVGTETSRRLREESEYCMVSMQATVHMGERKAFCPRSQLDDGLMDVLTVPKQSRVALARKMDDAVTGKHVDAKSQCPQRTTDGGDYIQVSHMVLRPACPSSATRALSVDGDLSEGDAFKIRVMPLALRVFA